MQSDRFDRTKLLLESLLFDAGVADTSVVHSLIAVAGDGSERYKSVLDRESTLATDSAVVAAITACLDAHADVTTLAVNEAVRKLNQIALESGRGPKIYELLEASDLCTQGEETDNSRFVFMFLDAFRPIKAGDAQRLLRAWRYDRAPEAIEALLPGADQIAAPHRF